MNVYTTEDMLRETLEEVEKGICEVGIFPEAVLDFKPATYSEEKVESGSTWLIESEPATKIIEQVSSHIACLVNRRGGIQEFKGTKAELSSEIFDRIEEGLIRGHA